MPKKAADKSLKPEREIRDDYEPAKRTYYFNGENKYQPEKIIAVNLQEATIIFNKIKKLI
jgi:hypothetical protein